MYENEENNKQIQLRLPARMRDDLRSLADRKGLNVSQLVRNYLETLLADNSKAPKETKESKLSEDDKLFGVRLPRNVHEQYMHACAESGLLASKYPRQIITDLSMFLLHETSRQPRPLSDTLRYLELFLTNECSKRGLRYVKTYERPRPLDQKAPLLQQLDQFNFAVNQGSRQYVIQFEPCNAPLHNPTCL